MQLISATRLAQREQINSLEINLLFENPKKNQFLYWIIIAILHIIGVCFTGETENNLEVMKTFRFFYTDMLFRFISSYLRPSKLAGKLALYNLV